MERRRLLLHVRGNEASVYTISMVLRMREHPHIACVMCIDVQCNHLIARVAPLEVTSSKPSNYYSSLTRPSLVSEGVASETSESTVCLSERLHYSNNA